MQYTRITISRSWNENEIEIAFIIKFKIKLNLFFERCAMMQFQHRLIVGLNERSFAEQFSISCSSTIKRGAEPHYR